MKYKYFYFPQSSNDNGGNMTEIKSHRVIDKPESVNLVNPPIIIIKATRIVINNNQIEIYLFSSFMDLIYISII